MGWKSAANKVRKERLKKVLLREGKELTNAELAERFGLNVSTVEQLRKEIGADGCEDRWLNGEDMKKAKIVGPLIPTMDDFVRSSVESARYYTKKRRERSNPYGA